MTIHYDKSKICPVCQEEFYWDDAKVSGGTWSGQVVCSAPCRARKERDRQREGWIPDAKLPDPPVDWDSPRDRGLGGRDWRQLAICRNEDPELFWPVGTTGPALKQIAEAKAVCRRCSVQASCLTWALESGQDGGIWGGLSEDERRSLKRRQARIKARAS